MTIDDILIPTAIIKPGMTVRDVFMECGRTRVQALPFASAGETITGRVTIKNIMKRSCLPEHMIELARVLGDQLSCLSSAEAKAKQIICNPVEPYVQDRPPVTISPTAPAMKAIAVMEQQQTSYLFVIDAEGRYRGVVTIQGIADKMSRLVDSCPVRQEAVPALSDT